MSTDRTKKIEQLLEQQESILKSIKAEARSIDSDLLVEENRRLSEELNEEKALNEQLAKNEKILNNELQTTKAALFSKMANEKLAAFERVQKKIDSYYYIESETLNNRLKAYEYNCRKSISETFSALDTYAGNEYDDIRVQLAELNQELDKRSKYITQKLQQEKEQLIEQNSKAGKNLRLEKLTQTEKRTAAKQKNIESFIGLNLLSKAGILLFLVGVIALGRFAYVRLPDLFKGGLIFALGIILIGIGELFHKKEKSVFSTALISGGVAVLYAAAATSYFALHLFSIQVTFVLCIIITAAAIALSAQLKSQVVCAFGAVGGYLPLIAAFMIGFGKAAADRTFLAVSGTYFCVIAIIIFIMTYNKKWYAAQFIGYGLHIIAIGGVARCAWALRNLNGYEYVLPFAVAFSALSFFVYLMMPGIKIVKGKDLSAGDVVLLGLNTVSGALSVGITMHNCFESIVSANRAVAAVFVLFMLLYVVLMYFSSRQKAVFSKSSGIILSLGTLVFSMLVIPFAFGWIYAAAAWAAEGTVLSIYSISKKIKISEFIGLFCIILSSVVLYLSNAYDPSNPYKAITLISLTSIIAALWIYIVFGLISAKEYKSSAVVYIVFEIISAVAGFAYLIYLYQYIIHGPFVNYYSDFTDCSVYVLLALLIVSVMQIGVLRNKASLFFKDIISVAILFVTIIFIDISKSYKSVNNIFGESVEPKNYIIFSAIVLIVVNIAVSISFAKTVNHIINEFSWSPWIYTAAISVSAVAIITAVLTSQFEMKFSNVIISAVYIITACILLFVGFAKRYTVVRFGGLILILCAFAKLCFIDTRGLDSGWKIASYFAFGTILITISYFYQRFSKKMEREALKITDNNSLDSPDL